MNKSSKDNQNKNYILNLLKEIFDIYCFQNNFSRRKFIIRLLYEKRLLDINKIDIFIVNKFLSSQRIKENDDIVTFKDFLNLVFFIYFNQISNQFENENGKGEGNKELEEYIKEENEYEGILNLISFPNSQSNSQSTDNIKEKDFIEQDNMKFNILKSLSIYREDYDVQYNYKDENNNRNTIKNNKDKSEIGSIFNKYLQKEQEQKKSSQSQNQSQSQSNKKMYSICYTDMNNDDILELIENINTMEPYKHILYDIFQSYSQINNDSNQEIIPFDSLIKIIIEKNIFNNYPSIRISDLLSKFMLPYKFNYLNDEFKLILDNPRISYDKSLIEVQLARFNLNLKDLNFSFSNFLLFISLFHKYLKANNEKSFEESITYYYNTVLEIDNKDNEEDNKRQSNEIDNLYDVIQSIKHNHIMKSTDFFPKSQILKEAIDFELTKEKENEDEDKVIKDFFHSIDKDLPNLTYSNLNIKQEEESKLPFPFAYLKEEHEENLRLAEKEKERLMIINGKKKENKKKEAPVKPLDFEEKKTDEDDYRKYFGSGGVQEMNIKKGKFKDSIRQKINGGYVYPVIINESLLIPNKIPNEIKVIIVNSFEDCIKGEYENGLSKLERAREECKELNIISEPQVNLYFNLILGSILETMELFGKAIIFYSEARRITLTSLSSGNPDIALVYCFIGGLLIKLNEPEYALRSYWKAKTLREGLIGGESLDTNAVYNNIGVCFYYLKEYYEAYGFIKLAYETYKEYDIFHERTISIRENLSKVNQLRNNKVFQFKTVSLFQGVKLNVINPKKAKKG